MYLVDIAVLKVYLSPRYNRKIVEIQKNDDFKNK